MMSRLVNCERVRRVDLHEVFGRVYPTVVQMFAYLCEIWLYDAPVAVEGDGHDAEAGHEDGGGLAGVGQLADPFSVDAERPPPVEDLRDREERGKRKNWSHGSRHTRV